VRSVGFHTVAILLLLVGWLVAIRSNTKRRLKHQRNAIQRRTFRLEMISSDLGAWPIFGAKQIPKIALGVCGEDDWSGIVSADLSHSSTIALGYICWSAAITSID